MLVCIRVLSSGAPILATVWNAHEFRWPHKLLLRISHMFQIFQSPQRKRQSSESKANAILYSFERIFPKVRNQEERRFSNARYASRRIPYS